MSPLDFFSSLPVAIFWLWLSAIVFLGVALLLILGPFRGERTELMTSFLGFLLGMGIFHLAGGAAMYWMNLSLMHLAAFGAITGSAFVLKFPLTAFPTSAHRRTIFSVALAIGWALVAWMIVTTSSMDLVMRNASIYMIVVSGALSGLYLVGKGFRLADPAMRVKCIGGGASIVCCCFLTHLIVITVGMTALAKVFMILTPVSLLLAVVAGRMMGRSVPVVAKAKS